MIESEFKKKVTIEWRRDVMVGQEACDVSMTCKVRGFIGLDIPEEARDEIKLCLEERMKSKLYNFMVKEFGGSAGSSDLKMAYLVGYDDCLAGSHCNPEKAVM